MGEGMLREFVLVRSPRGDPFSHQTDNPDRISYQMEEDGDCTYMSTLFHAVTYERKITGKFIQELKSALPRS